MRKMLLSLLVVIALAFSLAPIAQAQEGGVEGVSTEGYVFTVEDLAQIAAKDQMARNHLNQVSIKGAYSKYLNVGPAETYREPNLAKYKNYCGPSSTQVAIRARKSAALVPSLDTVGVGEHVNPTYGVKIFNIRPYINQVLGTTWYAYATSKNQDQFSTWARLDVDVNYVLITGLYTLGMPGWRFGTNHIVAVYGYSTDANNKMSIAYVDTGSELAGHHYNDGSGGKYFNITPLDTFYKWVYHIENNLQVW